MKYTSSRDDEAAMKVYRCGGTSALLIYDDNVQA